MLIFNYPAMMVIVSRFSKDLILRFVINKFGVSRVPKVPRVPVNYKCAKNGKK